MQAEVSVTQIDGSKLWVKAVLAKKRGGFTKLIEAMTDFGFELTDTSVTTSCGAMLVSSCVIVSIEKTHKPSTSILIQKKEKKYFYSMSQCTVQNRHK